MKLRDLFRHKLLEARVKTKSSEEGLVYAVSYDVNLSKIFLYVDGRENDVFLGDRWHTVTSLCTHNNWLYDGGYKYREDLGFVIDTITGKDVMERKNNPVHSLCSHNGKLYRGDSNGGIYEVSPFKLVAVRFGKVTTLCSHEGTLYDGGYYQGVYDTLRDDVGNKKVINKKKYVTYLCSGNNRLFGVDYKHNKYLYFEGVIFDVLKGKKIKGIRETLTSMCFHKDDVYYSYSDVIIGLNDEWLRHDKKGIQVTAICSIPKELKEQIIHKKNYGFDFNEVQRINPKGAIEYLTHIVDYQERRRLIEQLFNCETINEEMLNWLNNKEEDTMRKAAFY
ncbi:hypothetical protein FJZ53_00255 [Candidatus Woesearchaeota archaeon]|nr:hypothetical protein [Candidatus Woesearchaeota archaeon]